MKKIEELLLKNGFKKVSDIIYQNDKCMITVIEKVHFSVEIFEENSVIYSHDLNYYWLLGVLIDHDLIDKSLKKIKKLKELSNSLYRTMLTEEINKDLANEIINKIDEIIETLND